MRAVIKTGVMTVCISAFLSLFGCKVHILDGPGMVNKAQWTEFSLSSSGSYAQSNYYFTVTDRDEDDKAFVTGECRDDEGNLYKNDSGIPVPAKTLTALRELCIDELEDIPAPSTSETDEFVGMDGLEMLDGDSVELQVFYFYDTENPIKKAVTFELAIQIYDILLPLFAESGAE